MLVRVFEIACVVGVVILTNLDHKMPATILFAAVLLEAFLSDWRKSRKLDKSVNKWIIIVEDFCAICVGLLLIAYIWTGQIWVSILIAIILGLGVICDIRLRKKKSTEEKIKYTI